MDKGIMISINDKAAPNANPNRGYHPSVCTVVFPDNLTEKGQEAWIEVIRQRFKNDMWNYPPVRVNATTWEIHHGYDSGD
jgi:hypothetical protein